MVITTIFLVSFNQWFLQSFVLRARQLPSAGVEKMSHARVSMYLPPDINPAQASIAYGCRALPKLNEELQSEDLLTRQKALMALCDLMHDPEHVYVAIDIGECQPG